jgi:hypothetical protein
MARTLSESQLIEVADLLKKVEELQVTDPERFTAWESEFISSVSNQFSAMNWISPEKQLPKLREIVEGDNGPRKKSRDLRSRGKKAHSRTDEDHRPGGGGFSGFG